jgi:pyridinium-3,5-bisthiocarboxylic acid mononucleotide nickel chelatase
LQLHLELAGGLTGDMFLAAVLDAFPQFEDRVSATIDAVEDAVPVVRAFAYCAAYEPFTFRSVCDRLNRASIDQAVRAHSRNLLRLLAGVQSAAHGVDAASIEFHEIGAWEAIADIVGAATLIDALDTAHWSASPVLVPEGMTPTGTAILRYLCPAGGSAAPKHYALVRSGTGFPSRSPCPCNPVRVLCFDEGTDSRRSARASFARIQPGSSRHN